MGRSKEVKAYVATEFIGAVVLAWLILAPFSRAAAPDPAPAFTHTLYLVRHGAYVPDPKADPHSGPGLTPLGIAQARLVAARLRGLPVHIDAMISSTLTRARETAAVIHQTLSDVPRAESPLLSECTPPALKSFKDETPEEQDACSQRLDAAFADFFKPARGADRTDLLVCHGNVIRYLVTKALAVDSRVWLNMSVAHASVTIIRVRADGSFSVLAVGDSGHLPPSLQSWGTEADPQL